MAINQAQLADLRTEYRRENWKGIQTPEWQRKIVSSMVDSQEPAILRRIAPHWKLPKDPAILARFRVRSGEFRGGCRKQGMRAFGVEPDRIGHEWTKASLQSQWASAFRFVTVRLI
jgi:hypothetical protein